MNDFYENKQERTLKNSAEYPERIEKPQNFRPQIEPDYKRNEQSRLEPLKIQKKKESVNFNEKEDFYAYQDSFNDRDNRFKINGVLNDNAAGTGFHRVESGKKLFIDKYSDAINDVLSWDSKEREKKAHSNESLFK